MKLHITLSDAENKRTHNKYISEDLAVNADGAEDGGDPDLESY